MPDADPAAPRPAPATLRALRPAFDSFKLLKIFNPYGLFFNIHNMSSQRLKQTDYLIICLLSLYRFNSHEKNISVIFFLLNPTVSHNFENDA